MGERPTISDPHVTGKFAKLEKVLLVLAIVGMVGFALLYFSFSVWSIEWGHTASPARVGWEYLHAFMFCLPLGLWAAVKFIRRNEWIDPPGRVTSGRTNPVFSPYTLTAIAIFAAVFCVAALAEAIRLDIQALSVATAAGYWGGIVAPGGLFFGQIIARMWFMPWVSGGGAGLIDLIAFCTLDAAIWAWAGYILFKYWHGKPDWSRLKKFVVCIPLIEVVHQGFWFTRTWVVNPQSAAIASVIADYTNYWPISSVLVVIGIVVGTSLRKR